MATRCEILKSWRANTWGPRKIKLKLGVILFWELRYLWQTSSQWQCKREIVLSRNDKVNYIWVSGSKRLPKSTGNLSHTYDSDPFQSSNSLAILQNWCRSSWLMVCPGATHSWCLPCRLFLSSTDAGLPKSLNTFVFGQPFCKVRKQKMAVVHFRGPES